MMKKLIAGNWKMNLTPAQSAELLDGLCAGLTKESTSVEVLVCPPFTSLSILNARMAGSVIRLGAQNVYPELKGAFTGEISPEMLLSLGCSYVLCGHSERRHIMGESDSFINQKVLACFKSNLTPILCVGETETERDLGLTFNVVERQLRTGLNSVTDSTRGFVIAYEPVWAIGTGKTATPEQAQQVHEYIRGILIELYPASGRTVRILYGGSVTPENSNVLLSQRDVNGALVGEILEKEMPKVFSTIDWRKGMFM